jgi:hypothetical protein
MSVEEAFAKVVGRQATEEERARLHRLRDALGLRDNDAFWSIVMALEHYDAFFRAYPAELARQTQRCIDQARAAFADAAAHEAARAERLLSDRVAETSVHIARKLADRPVRLHPATTVLAAVVAFGALCEHAGYRLATADTPPWATRTPTAREAQHPLSILLTVPAGWMIFALLLPVAAYGAHYGWTLGRDALSSWHERTLGWLIVALCVAGAAACAVVLANEP